jgi:hypothetical protein
MKKNEQLQLWLEAWDPNPESPLPREYRAYFHCFNSGQYYEAHDVLEHLWLRCTDSNRSFYQGLIQLAGAFVHFRKHADAPTHPTHSRRLGPGQRLLDLASGRLRSYGASHLEVNIEMVLKLCVLWKERATLGSPLLTFPAPQLILLQ